MKGPLAALVAAMALTLTSCSTGTAVDETETGQKELTLHVLAAASLQASFDEIADDFSTKHPGISIDFNYAGTSTLVQNLEAGSPADVFASANEHQMDRAADAGTIATDTRERFAANSLVGIVPSDNPAEVSNLKEANAHGVNLVVCAPQVPCGALSQVIAERANITLNPVSEEHQVTDALGKVRSGQADAGLVYTTDAALAADEIETFDIAGSHDELSSYPIARTSNSTQPAAADAFIEFVHSDAGQAILEAHGFTTP